MKKIVLFVVFLLSFSTSTFSATETSDYSIEKVTVNTVSTHADSDARGQNSTYVDPYKQAANSGETKVNLVSSNCGSNEYEYAEIKGEKIQFTGCSSSFDTAINEVSGFDISDGNDIIMKNGNIVYADEAISYTTGGINYVGMIYPTVEDAHNATNGVTISGGAFDMAYYGTTSYNNKLYYEVMVGDLKGYISASEAAILPTEMIESQSYYMKEGNELVYYYSITPIDDEYASMVLGLASPEMQEGIKYYSYDDVNYYTSPMTNSVSTNSATLVDYNYWQNLPVTSTSSGTAQEYKDYLNYKGKSSSEYINETDGFVTAEDNYGFNSTLLFAHANLESAYGTSSYARTCHNFFGMGAYDNNPDNACNSSNGGVDFQKDDQIDDAIVAQSIFMKENYQDIYDWRFYGNHFGNKSSGFNVYYASDPNWGKSVGSIAYEFDKYTNNLETGYYTIAQTTSYTEVYSTPTGSTTYTLNASQGSSSGPNYEYAYRKGGVASTGGTSGMNIIILDDSQSRYQIQLPTPLKQGSEACNNVDTSSGYMHNFRGVQSINVSSGQANSYCKYGWSDEKGYINKSDVNIINDVPPKPIGSTYTVIDYPQPVIMKTVNANTITYYGKTIPLQNTYIPVVGKVFLDNSFKGWVIQDYVTEEYDVVLAGDLNWLTTNDAATIGFSKGTAPINVYESSNTSQPVEKVVSQNNVAFPITNTTQSQVVNGDPQWNYVQYDNYCQYVTKSNGWANNSQIAQYKPTDYVGYDNTVTLSSDGQLSLEGYGYIKYVDSPTDASIDHTIQIKDSSGNIVYSQKMTDTNNYSNTSNGHESGVYNYDSSGFETTLNLATLNLPVGNYTFNLGIDQAGYYVSAPYKIHEDTSINDKYYNNGKIYTVYSENNVLKMHVEDDYNPTKYVGYDTKVKMDASGNITFDGYAYIQYIEAPNADAIKKTVEVVNSSGIVVTSKVMTDNTNYMSTTDSHDGGMYNYNYAGYNGTINISNLPTGNYTFNLKVESGGHTVNIPYVIHQNYSYSNQVYLNSHSYKLYTTNNTLKLEVKDYNPTKYVGYDTKVKMDASGNITFDGYAYIQYIEAPNADAIKKTVEVINSSGTVVTSKVMTDNTNYINTTDSHDGGKYNYNYAGYNGSINISNLPAGDYTFNLKVESGGTSVNIPYVIHQNYSYSNQIYLNNKTYKLYSSNNTLKLEVKDYNPTKYVGYDTKVKMDASGNITFDGYAYIQYIEAPNTDAIKKTVEVVNSSGTVVTSKVMTDNTNYMSTTDSHDGGMYNYNYAGYNGTINISNLPTGNYTFNLKVESGGHTVNVPYVIHQNYSYSNQVYLNSHSYKLYTTNNTLKLEVKDYNPTKYVGYDTKVKMDASGNIIFDGYAYIQYIEASNADAIKKTVEVINSSGTVVTSKVMTDNTNYVNTTDSHDGGKYNYNYAGYNGSINISNLPAGNYTFNLKVESAGYVVNVPYVIHQNYSYSNQIYLNNKTYKLYTTNNTLKLEVKDYSPTKYVGYDTKVKMDASGNITFDGYAYIQYIEAPNADAITKTVEVINSSGTVVTSKVMTDNTNYVNTTDSHDGGKYNYNYAGYNGVINISNLPAGNYTFNLKVESAGYVVNVPYVIHQNYSYSNQIYLNNKTYKLYSSNNTLKLEVKDYNPTKYVGYDTKVKMDVSGNITFDGYAYIQYIEAPNADAITKTVEVINSSGTVVTSKVMTDNTNYMNTTDSHDGGKYNYDYAGYNGVINITNLPKGEYSINLKVESGGYVVNNPYVIHENYQYNSIIKIGDTNYKLYTQNNVLKLSIY